MPGEVISPRRVRLWLVRGGGSSGEGRGSGGGKAQAAAGAVDVTVCGASGDACVCPGLYNLLPGLSHQKINLLIYFVNHFQSA